MKHDRLLLRIWMDITGLVVPLFAMAAHVLGWSEMVRTLLTVVCVAGVLGTGLVMTDMARWRAAQRARSRRLRGRLPGARRH